MESGDTQIEDEYDELPEESFVRFQEPTTSYVDIVVGHLEEIMMSDHFLTIQDKFMNENYNEFDENEENKFSYTEIHEKYINTVERLLEEQLCERIPHFSMRSFIDSLVSNNDCLDGEVFDMLYTFSDFLAFKEMMVDYKKVKTGQIVNLELTNSSRHSSFMITNDQAVVMMDDPLLHHSSSCTMYNSCASSPPATTTTTTYTNGMNEMTEHVHND
ncbi:unnamed protein product [Schistosoma turkestanicum]|nr:unnamed protein product [Schistosoma turkestanicum]